MHSVPVEAVLSAGKDIPVGVCSRCLLDVCVRNASSILVSRSLVQQDKSNAAFLAPSVMAHYIPP